QLTVIRLFVLVERHVPFVVLSELSSTPAGRGSDAVAPVAPDGPRLLTVTVYVSGLSCLTGSGESVFVTAMSAVGVTVVVAVAVLFAGFGSVVTAETLAVFVSVPVA